MKQFKNILAFSLTLFVTQVAFSQNSLIGTWTFTSISNKDSIFLNTSEKAKIREFIIKQEKIHFDNIPLNLLDTVNERIDKEVDLLCNSFIKFNTDNTLEISRSEILIPRAIPGIIKDSTLNGIWNYDENTQVVTLETSDNFRFFYKIIKLEKDKLTAGMIYTETENPRYSTVFIRKL